jgi:fructose-bisphosphate aldolase class II
MLKKAQAEGYAVGMFDCNTLEGILAVIEAAVEERSPALIAPIMFDRRAAVGLIRELAVQAPVPIGIELDHGRDFQNVMECIRAGFTDVMIDASIKPYEENVALTSKVVEAAHAAGVGVEAELGHVGRAAEQADAASRRAGFTDPAQAAAFVAATGVDFLAIAVGSAHGQYIAAPELDFELLEQIRQAIDIPLVLHGGSGIDDDDFRRAVAGGICKVNIHTAMALAAVETMRNSLQDPKMTYGQISREVREAIKGVVTHHMRVFGSSGRV